MITSIFLDANVLVSVIMNEYPKATFSAKVISLAQDFRFKVYTSPHALSICHYFGEKAFGRNHAYKKVAMLTTKLHITSHLSKHVDLIYDNSKIEDFEDGLQYFSALDAKCKAIITYNTKDFYFSEIPIFIPKDFLLQDAQSRKNNG